MEEGKLLEEAAREIIKGGPLAVILWYVLTRVERSLNQLRDAVQDLLGEMKKGETKRMSESH